MFSPETTRTSTSAAHRAETPRRDGAERFDAARLEAVIARAHEHLIASQAPDGHWVGELEADSTISSEYLLFCHLVDRVDRELLVERRLRQGSPLAQAGEQPQLGRLELDAGARGHTLVQLPAFLAAGEP